MTRFQSIQALAGGVLVAYPRRAAAVVGLGLVKGVTEGVALVMLLPILALFGIGDAAVNPFVTSIRDMFATVGVSLSLGVALSLVFVLGAVSAMVTLSQTTLATYLVRQFVRDLQIATYSRIIEADVFYLVRQKLGDSLGTLTKFAEQTGNGVNILFRATTDLLLSLVLLAVAVSQSANYVALIIAIAALAAAPLFWHFRRIGRLVTSAHMQTRRMNAEMGDHLRLAFTIKAFGAQKESRRHLASEISAAATLLARLRVQVAAARAVLEPAMLLLLCATIYVGFEIFAVPTDRLLLIVLVFLRLVPRVISLIGYLQQMPELAAAHGRILDVQKDASSATPAKGGTQPGWQRLTGDIVFDRLAVAADQQPILQEISLTIPPQGITAILGPSGSGKSTLVAALLGLVRPNSGSILVEGADLATVDGDKWRARLGYVGQDAPLFHASVRENLRFALPDADDSAMMSALDQAGLGSFLRALPRGLDAVVGEGGGRMSGGERQRLALARALLRKPLALILDEPTSALDWETAQRLLETIETLADDIPVLLVTHDLHLARSARLIYLLETGKLSESGTWPELVAGKGQLAALRGIRSTH